MSDLEYPPEYESDMEELNKDLDACVKLIALQETKINALQRELNEVMRQLWDKES